MSIFGVTLFSTSIFPPKDIFKNFSVTKSLDTNKFRISAGKCKIIESGTPKCEISFTNKTSGGVKAEISFSKMPAINQKGYTIKVTSIQIGDSSSKEKLSYYFPPQINVKGYFTFSSKNEKDSLLIHRVPLEISITEGDKPS